MTLIKICGLTTVADALSVAALDVDIIGMVFAESQRRITRQLATEISRSIRQKRRRPALAGVFVNQPAGSVNGMAAACGLDIVQLSGDESWDYCHELNHPFIKVIHISDDSTPVSILNMIENGHKAGFKQPFICMLDCKIGDGYGGSGASFDWEIAAHAALRFPLIVAGGLHSRNVRKLIRQAGPCGVDVSSGVESAGKKDIEKVGDFVRAVRLTGGGAVFGREILTTLLKGKVI
jgi:phosphoribosylanthranilate isomerase